MKWFKHDSDASMDAKLRRLRNKHGMEGYGLYWYCLELVAQSVQRHNLTFELEHDSELISADVGIHQERVQEIMEDMVKWGLFEQNSGVITCLKMATRTDEYTQQLIRTSRVVGINSLESPDNVPVIRTEQKRTEEKRIEKKRPCKKNNPPDIELPDWLDLTAWNEFVEHRKEKKDKLTSGAIKKNLKVLEENKDRQAEIIDTAIRSGWRGLFPPRGNAQSDPIDLSSQLKGAL